MLKMNQNIDIFIFSVWHFYRILVYMYCWSDIKSLISTYLLNVVQKGSIPFSTGRAHLELFIFSLWQNCWGSTKSLTPKSNMPFLTGRAHLELSGKVISEFPLCHLWYDVSYPIMALGQSENQNKCLLTDGLVWGASLKPI